MCFYNKVENNMCHIWTYAGNPDYFPYEGMNCDCGEIKYHLSKQEEEKRINNLYAQDWVKNKDGKSFNRGLISNK